MAQIIASVCYVAEKLSVFVAHVPRMHNEIVDKKRQCREHQG